MTHPTPTEADKERANTLVFRRVLSGEYESVYSIPPDIWEQDIAAALAIARAAEKVEKRWTFDNNQQHTHTWHDWAAVVPELRKALAGLGEVR